MRRLLATLACALTLTACRGLAAAPPPPIAPPPIIAIGDSLTYGYGAYSLGRTVTGYGPPPDHSYPADMQRDLNVPVVNAGVGGDTAGQMNDPSTDPHHNRPYNLQLPALLAQHPRLMVIGFGSAEAIRQYPISQTVADFHSLMDKIAAAGVPMVLVGTHVDCNTAPCVTPAPGQPNRVYTTDWDNALTSLANQYNAGLVIDVEQGFQHSDLYDNWVHASAQGYQLMADRVEVAVRAKLGI
jgi:lysophospholipase L1-like esterase